MKPTLDIDEVITCQSVSDKALHIKERVKNGPVLVRCASTLTAELELKGCSILKVTEDIDS